MVMNPRTHPRGAPPDFTLPKPNPNPKHMTDALWWLVCMREALEPADSENGGTFVDKPAYHNAGENLPDHGLGDLRTDASIRRAPDREGPWWRTKTAAHDWTFFSAQRGDYANINKYVKRLVNAMRSLTDLRPDDVYAYTIGQLDGDVAVEGWNEYRDDWETGDKTHLWHRHDSFRRNIVGNFWAMWKALTIDMGWTYDEWLKSTEGDDDMTEEDRAQMARILLAVRETAESVSTGRKAEVARDAQVAATLAGMQSALASLAAAKGALTPEQVALLVEQVRQAAQIAGAEAVSVLTDRMASLQDHLGDDQGAQG